MQQMKSGYRVTAKFNAVMLGTETGLISLNGSPVVQETPPPAIVKHTAVNWQLKFLQFITDSDVPSKGNGSTGDYDLKLYSEPAMKEFRRMIEKEHINYDLLVLCTKLYYRTRSTYPKKISAYILEGLWRSLYMELETKGTPEEIRFHVQTELNNARRHTNWKSAYD